VRAGETGSFSRVARELGVSQPSISRMVADLEARLGVKLLLRTTRHVTPTDAGRVFLERARQILGDLDDAENAARSGQPARHIAGGVVGGIRNSRSHPPPAWLRGAASETRHRALDVRPARGPDRRR